MALLGLWYRNLVALHNLGLAYLVGLLTLQVKAEHSLDPSNLAPGDPRIEERLIHWSIRIGCRDQELESTELGQAVVMGVADVEGNAPFH